MTGTTSGIVMCIHYQVTPINVVGNIRWWWLLNILHWCIISGRHRSQLVSPHGPSRRLPSSSSLSSTWTLSVPQHWPFVIYRCTSLMIWYDKYLLTLHISMLCASNQRSGWSSLVVTQPSTDHQLMCVCVCVLLCLAFIIAVHLGNKVIFYSLSPLTS